MSSIDTYVGQRSAASTVKPYFLIDTDKDDVIAPDELVVQRDAAASALGPDQDNPTVSSADALSDPVAAALIDVHQASDPAAVVSDALAAYHSDTPLA